MKDLLIFPYNGNGKEAIDCLGNSYNLIGFVDDNIEKQGISEFGCPVYPREILEKYPKANVLAVPGSPANFQSRRNIIVSLNIAPDRFATVIHPNAQVSRYAKIGTNCLLYAGVVITASAILGNHICILPNSVVHHDTIIKDYTLIGSNVCIAGHVTIGENCYIGSGTNVINNITISDGTLAGLGSNVIHDVASFVKVVGNPAREI